MSGLERRFRGIKEANSLGVIGYNGPRRASSFHRTYFLFFSSKKKLLNPFFHQRERERDRATDAARPFWLRCVSVRRHVAVNFITAGANSSHFRRAGPFLFVRSSSSRGRRRRRRVGRFSEPSPQIIKTFVSGLFFLFFLGFTGFSISIAKKKVQWAALFFSLNRVNGTYFP